MIELKKTTTDGVFLGGVRTLPEGPQTLEFIVCQAVATAGEQISGIPALGVRCGENIVSWRSLSKSVLTQEGGEVTVLRQESDWLSAVKEVLAPLVGKQLSEVVKTLNSDENLKKVLISHKSIVGVYGGQPYPRTLTVITLRK